MPARLSSRVCLLQGNPMRRNALWLLAMGLTASAIATGCGGDGGETTTPIQGPPAGGSSGNTLQIQMADDFFTPKDASAKAGSVTISSPNTGQLVHELVLAKTSADPSKLPTTSDGEVDEAKLESLGEDAGEIADVAPGATKKGTFKLTPGKYVMFCNIPGHYAQGMYGTITVK
jgi:uncharacterized cupredoxin-like copper-binding protein